MKKITVLAAALAMVFAGSFAFAEKYVSANDLTKQVLTSDISTEDGFVIHATDAKNVEIQENDSNASPASVGDETFSMRIKLGGAGNLVERSVSIKGKKGQKLTVYARSTGDQDRTVNILDGEGNVVGTGPAPNKTAALGKTEVKLPADGEFYACSAKSGIYIFEMILE